MEEKDSSSSSSESDVEMENWRSVKLSAFNLDSNLIGLMPSTLSLNYDSTYSEANQQINDRFNNGNHDITFLMETFGPWPHWGFPVGNEKIPQATKTLYLVDRNKPFLIALVRTEDCDRPLVVDLPDETGPTMTRTILSLLESSTSAQGLNMVSARMYKGSGDLRDQEFSYSALQNLPKFPTTFYISCYHSDKVLRVNSIYL